jgi:predicted nucleic acid-binding protein
VNAVVIDTSLAVKWIVPENHQAEALSLVAGWVADGTDVIVPSWFSCELANVLFQRMRRGDMTLADAQLAFGAIFARVSVREPDPAVALRALEVTDNLGLCASYDAHYLALAEYLGVELWTADDHFWNAAKGGFPWMRWVGQAQLLSIPPGSNPAS